MIATIKSWAGVVALVAILLFTVLPVFLGYSQPPQGFGSTVNGGKVTDYDAVNTLAGYWVNGTQVVTSTGNLISATSSQINSVQTVGGYDNTFTAATTTPVAIQAPNATSTLIVGACRVDVASSSQNVVLTIAKGSTAYATTTALGRNTFAAGAQGTLVASTTETNVAIDPAYVFAPNSWLVLGMEGGTGGVTGSAPSGVCVAEWVKVN